MTSSSSCSSSFRGHWLFLFHFLLLLRAVKFNVLLVVGAVAIIMIAVAGVLLLLALLMSYPGWVLVVVRSGEEILWTHQTMPNAACLIFVLLYDCFLLRSSTRQRRRRGEVRVHDGG